MISEEQVRHTSRRLRDLVEPLAANVYFAPEPQREYRELGLSYLPSYFCSRAACMGQVPDTVVTAAFGVFKPALVARGVHEGWSKTDAPTILSARRRGATAALGRILGEDVTGIVRATALLRQAGEGVTLEGRPLCAGLVSLDIPDDPLGALWRAADVLREHRGDCHTVAWVGAGIRPVEITLLTELWWRIPLRSYVTTRGWSTEEIDDAVAALEDRRLIDGDVFTPEGEALRSEIEEATDRQQRGVVEALGDDADELFELLAPWSKAVLASGGYPSDPSSLSRR